MSKILFLIFIISNISFSQDMPSEVTEVEENSTEVSFFVIENYPIYKGCDKFSNNEDLKKYMSDKILEHVAKEFKMNVVKGLGLPDGIVKINVIFKVNAKGEVVDATATAPHAKLEEEAVRVINLIPKFHRAAIQRGHPITV